MISLEESEIECAKKYHHKEPGRRYNIDNSSPDPYPSEESKCDTDDIEENDFFEVKRISERISDIEQCDTSYERMEYVEDV